MRTSRRSFLTGCSAAIAAMAGSRLGYLGFAGAQPGADPATATNRETLVVVFLRGGMDGLSLIPPIAGDDRGYYEAVRPVLKIPTSGVGAALPLNAQFGWHPSAAAFQTLFQAGRLAVIQAVGASGSRSHFDAMKYLELGTPGVKSTADGWLTRHLSSSPALPASIIMPALATGSTSPTSLQGSNEVVALADSTTLQLGQIGNPSWAAGDQWAALRRLFGLEDTFLHSAGIQALNAAGLFESYVQSTYVPGGGARYPVGEFGQQLMLLAQLIKSDVGLRVATVDLGGWDTHESQGIQPGGHFSNMVLQLSEGLAALNADLDGSTADAPIKRVTVVVLSEFGRRLRENSNRGTDHGTGNPVLVMGGNVRGGLHGTWPGLHPDQLFDGVDIAPVTDLRRVLSEILIRRAGNPKLGEVFPRYANYQPLDIVLGTDQPPDYSFAIPVTPADFAARRLSDTAIRLTWTQAKNATNYRIERRTAAAGAWEFVIILGAGTSRHDDNLVPAGVTPAYRVQAFNSHGEGGWVEASVSAGADPLSAWRFRHFGTTSNTGAAADGAVASGDGLTNYAKYALGLDPLVPASKAAAGFAPGRPALERTATDVSLVFVRPVERTDVRYEVLASADLQTWAPVAVVGEGVQGGFERLRARVASPDPLKHFLKLIVQPA